MSVTYKNAPLLELIAELRWGDGVAPAATATMDASAIRLTLGPSKEEELFMQFFAGVSAKGYGRFERLLPSGFPSVPGQVISRFRPTDPTVDSPLFQLGRGVFTANALPPYESWKKFSPHVREGIECLIAAHDKANIPRPRFGAALIRYIDAFRNNLTRGVRLREFLRDTMKIDLVLPDVISSRAKDEREIVPTIKLTIPTAMGRLELAFSEGQVANERAILADMSVLILRDMHSEVDEAIQALTEGRQLIHEVFRGLTAPLHEAMEPQP